LNRKYIALGFTLYVAMIFIGISLKYTELWSLNTGLTILIVNHTVGSTTRLLASVVSLTASVFAVWMALLLIITYVYVRGGSINLKAMVTLSLLTLMLTEVVVMLSKYHFSILRPGVNMTVSYVGSEVLKLYAYPSGHSARSTVMAYWLPHLVMSIGRDQANRRRLYMLISFALWLWVAVVSLCRVIAQEHYVLDVVGGVLTGLGSVFLMKPLLPLIKERIS